RHGERRGSDRTDHGAWSREDDPDREQRRDEWRPVRWCWPRRTRLSAEVIMAKKEVPYESAIESVGVLGACFRNARRPKPGAANVRAAGRTRRGSGPAVVDAQRRRAADRHAADGKERQRARVPRTDSRTVSRDGAV